MQYIRLEVKTRPHIVPSLSVGYKGIHKRSFGLVKSRSLQRPQFTDRCYEL